MQYDWPAGSMAYDGPIAEKKCGKTAHITLSELKLKTDSLLSSHKKIQRGKQLSLLRKWAKI